MNILDESSGGGAPNDALNLAVHLGFIVHTCSVPVLVI